MDRLAADFNLPLKLLRIEIHRTVLVCAHGDYCLFTFIFVKKTCICSSNEGIECSLHFSCVHGVCKSIENVARSTREFRSLT